MPLEDLAATAPKKIRAQVWVLGFILSIATVTSGVIFGGMALARSAAIAAVGPIQAALNAHEFVDAQIHADTTKKLDDMAAQVKDSHDMLLKLDQWRQNQQTGKNR